MLKRNKIIHKTRYTGCGVIDRAFLFSISRVSAVLRGRDLPAIEFEDVNDADDRDCTVIRRIQPDGYRERYNYKGRVVLEPCIGSYCIISRR